MDERLLARVGRAVDLTVDPGEPPAAEDVIRMAEARAAAAAARPVRTVSRWRLVGGLVTAAAAVLAGFALWNARDGPLAQEFVTGPGETAMVRLSDGSLIRLGPESRLRTPSGALEREVTLQGEAFFSIALNEYHPFRITTGAGTARVLGTRFHLLAGTDELRVVVVEGRVALATTDQEVQVGAGQMTSLVGGRTGPVLDAPPIEEVADWLSGFLVFQDTPLETAMEEIAQRFGVEVVMDDSAPVEQTLTMWFSSKSLEEILTVVCGVIDARCGIDEGVVRVRSRDEPDGSAGRAAGRAIGRAARPDDNATHPDESPGRWT